MHTLNGLNKLSELDKCSKDTVEVVVFGSGYGESVLVHLKNDNWIIVDSCRPRDIAQPAPLEYLKRIGVSYDKVVAVIATHWDDDHIKGLGQVVESCEYSEFYMSAALKQEEFFNLIDGSSLSRVKRFREKVSSGVSEFERIFKVIKQRGGQPRYAIKDRQLLGGESYTIYSLSPSDSVFERAMNAIKSQIKVGEPVKRITAPRPNHTTVVTWIKIDGIRILLGGDMEETRDFNGWSTIIQEKQQSVIDQKAEIFKVSHHGSETGDCGEVWTELLGGRPYCFIAPFNKGGKLPTYADRDRILANAEDSYITASPYKSSGFKFSGDNMVKRRLLSRKVTFADSPFSFIRARKDEDEWNISLFGQSMHLSDLSESA